MQWRAEQKRAIIEKRLAPRGARALGRALREAFLDPLETVLFVVFGIAVGAYGAIVGAGGGFLVVPMLLAVLQVSAQQAVGTSMVVVFLNAVSATVAFARQRRIDYRSGIIFAVAALPGSVVGALLTTRFDSAWFKIGFGLLLIGLAVYLMLRPEAGAVSEEAMAARAAQPGMVCRTIVDCEGKTFIYYCNERQGAIISFFVGFFSSALGIGGGIIQTPIMVQLYCFPSHIAAATSMLIITVSTFLGVGSHLVLGHVLVVPALAIGVGALAGAQLGAFVARRAHGQWLMRALAAALLLVGVRLLLP